LNTVALSHRSQLEAIIGQDALHKVLDDNQVVEFDKYDNDKFKDLKHQLGEAFNNGGVSGMRLYIIEERSKIYKTLLSANARKNDVVLQVLDIFKYL
jgi:hypothetical protein